jgi:DNA-binding MurR/RpiR family transcriptional regulator
VTPSTPRRARPAADTVDAWLQSLLPERPLGEKAAAVWHQLLTRPSHASFAKALEVATAAGTTVATVTRLAQTLGFEGWPDFQRQLRTRYLSHLSLVDVADAHSVDEGVDQGATKGPALASLRQDLDALSALAREVDHDQLQRMADRIAAARRVFISAEGSYASVALAMAHNTRLAGYDAQAIIDGGATLANVIAALRPDDVYVVVSFWRLYRTAVRAAQRAKDRGATVLLIADTVPPRMQRLCDETLLVPGEGASFFPSLTAAFAAQQAIVSALAAVDRARTRASIKAAEESWQYFELLQR